MAVQREQGPGGGSGSGGAPVPRDMPDQQARQDADPWDVASGRAADDEPDEEAAPDPDEAGTGPRGAPRSGTVHPEHPTPEEPTA
ncbi:hypothetical protein JK361_05100 [Streptomyces sp. 5-8]|uniref:Uncharacterized protein n=1 Tax=Streptomyces musisoli TaxID=2802280 RepID=A0ABS1NVF7_9ACTN|nr:MULTISPECIES: hypothetical protein [Streptomyces]MBL1103989.1 hypothetical protein [Streptomyces musisoli]MBY8840062.1 hypothetical protein [Streptomyces sp. SP2-10]